MTFLARLCFKQFVEKLQVGNFMHLLEVSEFSLHLAVFFDSDLGQKAGSTRGPESAVCSNHVKHRPENS